MGLPVSESSNLRGFFDGLDAIDGVNVATGVATLCDHIAAMMTTCVRSESVSSNAR
jgi:hypothetical protein